MKKDEVKITNLINFYTVKYTLVIPFIVLFFIIFIASSFGILSCLVDEGSLEKIITALILWGISSAFLYCSLKFLLVEFQVLYLHDEGISFGNKFLFWKDIYNVKSVRWGMRYINIYYNSGDVCESRNMHKCKNQSRSKGVVSTVISGNSFNYFFEEITRNIGK